MERPSQQVLDGAQERCAFGDHKEKQEKVHTAGKDWTKRARSSDAQKRYGHLRSYGRMLNLFRRGGGAGDGQTKERGRASRGWPELLKHLRAEPSASLRVLDFGATSPGNINLLTSLGHSVYMANIVGEAQKPEWVKNAGDGPGSKPEYDVERFRELNLDFSGRDFDVVLLWDTADYLPVPFVPVLFERLREVTRPGGRLLAFFHNKPEGADVGYARYHLADGPELRLVGNEALPIRQVLQNRQIERYLDGFGTVRFFQGTDNLREVLAIR